MTPKQPPRKPGIKNPHHTLASRLRCFLLSTPAVATVTMTTGVVLGRRYLPSVEAELANVWRFGGLAMFAGVGLVGGLAIGKCLGYLRRHAIKKLLTYDGWLKDAGSNPDMRTKLWAIFLKLLIGPGPHGLFEFEDLLPHLPLPRLEDTCRKFLENVEPLLEPEEFKKTQNIVDEFCSMEGQTLQHYIVKRARKNRNWLADWWLEENYLKNRQPVAVNVNFFMSSMVKPNISTSDVMRAASCAYHVTSYYQMICEETLLPDMIQDFIPVSMDNLKYMLASCRIPHVAMDTLFVAKNSKHIIVLCKGEYYRLEMYKKNGKPLSIGEIRLFLEIICNKCEGVKDANRVAVLTSADRDTWTKNRELLLSNRVNASACEQIESAIFILVLGSTAPKDLNELVYTAMVGDGTTRWFDKGLTVEVFQNSGMAIGNMEHSAADATHFNVMWEHCLQLEAFGEEKEEHVITKMAKDSNITQPIRLEWQFSDKVAGIIEESFEEFQKLANRFSQMTYHTKYGKRWMKSKNLSPDGYLQMAIQLTYYKMHASFTKTYEPASHRLFTKGRTENINPVSEASVSFVLGFLDPHCSREEKIRRLRDAVDVQNRRRLEATAGFGVDRHLLGLCRAAGDMGMDLPGIFKTKAYNLEMKLVTSQVPTNIAYYVDHVVPSSCLGGFGPACEDGYGLLYANMGDNLFNFNISGWKSSEVTDVEKFIKTLDQSLDEMKMLLDD